MSHSSDAAPEMTDECPTPRHGRGRRSTDHLTPRMKVIGTWCVAILGLGAVSRGGWAVLQAVVHAQESYVQFGAALATQSTSIQQISASQAAVATQVKQVQQQLDLLVRHDSTQDATLHAERRHIADIERVIAK